jgi:ribosome-associated translation inhibitor RaiA
MNVDIQTEHVVMLPEWHRMIDEWLERCRKWHPGVLGIDLTLRHGERPQPGEEVEAVATACGRSLRATRHAALMTLALHDVLDALEQEVLVHEALGRTFRH